MSYKAFKNTITLFINTYRKNKKNDIDVAEKKAIAKAFNDRYAYRKVYDETKPRINGESYYGFPHSAGHAWMCPDCNKVYHPCGENVFTGIQYPNCCNWRVGHKWGGVDNIRTS